MLAIFDIVIFIVTLFAMGISGTELKGEVPAVRVEGGNLLNVNMDAADIDAGRSIRSLKFPDIYVNTIKETFEVPTLSVTPESRGYTAHLLLS